MATKAWKIIEKRNFWFSISLFVICVGFGLMAMRVVNGASILNFGTDFAGGNTMVLRFDQLNDTYRQLGHDSTRYQQASSQFIVQVRSVLATFGLHNSTIQISGEQDVIIKTPKMTEDKSVAIRDSLTDKLGRTEILEIDYIGPAMGAELRTQAILIVILVCAALTAYISWRFELCYAVGAVGAVAHDALIMIAVASIFNMEIDTAFVAAVLTVLGYSINDTIVIFDRIRENLAKFRLNNQVFDLKEVLNTSIRETIGRTINTVLTVIIVLVALIVFGGSTIQNFCMALLVGILAGTYSSIFIASPLVAIAYPKQIGRNS